MVRFNNLVLMWIDCSGIVLFLVFLSFVLIFVKGFMIDIIFVRFILVFGKEYMVFD